MSKPTLAEALSKATATPTPKKQASPRPERASKPSRRPRGSSTTPPGREGKKTVIAYVDPAAVRELKILAAKKDATQQDLIVEALNDLFVKHGMKPIA